ncbi:hypothetical protein [Nannocystis punicea]|uniref:Mersacidin/lichenicidin family type 2 lantibiotic n=1 Tax=Nannocystis punicea TaxID=2995304 RepID=A0ABY7HB28_9BACT|nr:hypothetical protein [Nannocystis poenicansa]WAS96480.1 hypothetical protein O0S08_10000 [Nannocystis poenicansa]
MKEYISPDQVRAAIADEAKLSSEQIGRIDIRRTPLVELPTDCCNILKSVGSPAASCGFAEDHVEGVHAELDGPCPDSPCSDS